MKIGIDIDDVVMEFVRGYLEIYKKNFKRDAKFESIFSYNLWESLNITKEEAIEIAEEFYDSALFENISFVEGSVDSINKLGDGNEIFFITSRPEYLRTRTEESLRKHFPFSHKLIFSGDFWGGKKTKAEICGELKLDFMIEDNENYSRDCAAKGIKVFMLDKPWNKNCQQGENLLRMNNWKEIMEKLGGKIEY